MKIRQINEEKVDEIILEAEERGKEEKNQQFKGAVFSGLESSEKNIGDKISLVLIFALLVLSIIQSAELFNLRNQILKGQFSSGTIAPASGAGQGLPAQQGGC